MTTYTVKGGYSKTQKRKVVEMAASGFVIDAVAGARLKVYQFSIQSQTDGMSVQLTDGNGGPNLDLKWALNAREGVVCPPSMPDTFYFSTSSGNGLYAVVAGGGTVRVAVSYWDDDPSNK